MGIFPNKSLGCLISSWYLLPGWPRWYQKWSKKTGSVNKVSGLAHSLPECQGWLHAEETAERRQPLAQGAVQLLKISPGLIQKTLCGKEMLLAIQWLGIWKLLGNNSYKDKRISLRSWLPSCSSTPQRSNVKQVWWLLDGWEKQRASLVAYFLQGKSKHSWRACLKVNSVAELQRYFSKKQNIIGGSSTCSHLLFEPT